MNVKKILWIGIPVLIVLWLFGSIRGFYNSAVQMDESINGQWSKVETAYQRRADLIPNLVNTVKGYADFERGVLTDVVEARSKATGIQLNAENLSAEQLAQFQEAQGQLSGALSRLLVTIERYPDLKANQNFLELQSQLEGTENRIQTERNRFNEAAQGYNAYIRRFPANLYAGFFGFDRRAYFEATAGAETAPDVSFD